MFCDLTPAQRVESAALWAGKLATVTYSRNRSWDSAHATTTYIIGTAAPLTGAASDELVVSNRPAGRGGDLFTISLATILELKLAPLATLERAAAAEEATP